MILAMQSAILQLEERFALAHGLPSPALVGEIKKGLHNVRAAMAEEPKALPRWKRKPNSCVTLDSGEVIIFGAGRGPAYLRRNYNIGDVRYLAKVRDAQRIVFTAEDAIAAMRKIKPDTSRSKRKPIEAEPDPYCPAWRSRPELRLTAEQMIRQQFTGRALERELRRIL